MTWSHLFKKANRYAQAAAEHAVDEHADPKIQLEQAITVLQEHHRDLQTAASRVLAQEKLQKGRLETLNAEEARLTGSAKAALDRGDQDTARAFAGKLASVRDQIKTISAGIPELEQAATDAREAVQESAEALTAKINERASISAEIDQTRVQEEVAASTKALSDLTSSGDVPSFDEIRDKVARQHAEASASNELASTDPAIQDMHAHHAEITADADAILAELKGGDMKPAVTET